MPPNKKIWKRKKAIAKSGDTLVVDGKPTDLVIAVMGPTGAGKSTFVNVLLEGNTTDVGHQLEWCTSRAKHFIRPLPSDPTKRLVVVDTPGFDDTDVDDVEILRRISVWLAASYTSDMKLAGVIYLHEITRPRMLGTTRKNLEMFRKLCGDRALSSVVLGTTKWSEVTTEFGELRLQQLKMNFWKDMIDGGTRVFKYENTHASAWSMVNYLLKKRDLTEYDVLQLQEKLVDLLKIIPDTDVGKELRYTLKQLLLKIQQDKATEEQTQKTLTAIQALKVPISSRLALFFSLQSGGLSGVVEEQFVDIRRSHRTYATEKTQESSYQVSKKTRTFTSMFKKSHHFTIGGAVLNDGDNVTVQYNDNVQHYHFYIPVDSEAMKLLVDSMERNYLRAGSKNQRVHIHTTT